jgi:hypothetical protein
VAAKKLSNTAALLASKEAWAEAYRRTPHGKPVEFGAPQPDPQHLALTPTTSARISLRPRSAADKTTLADTRSTP